MDAALIGQGLLSGLLFSLYHIPVYGQSPQLLVAVLLDGTTIMAVDIATGRLVTGILAHVANNLMSFLVKGSLLAALGAPASPFVPHLLLPLTQMAVPVFALSVLVYKKRGVLLR